jgi:hypothetical protein
MYPPDSVYSLWYYPDINRFADEDGYILHDLSDRFDVWELDEWKKTCDYGILIDRRGNLCEVFYPTEEEDEDWPVTPLFLSRPVRQTFNY